MTNLTKVSFLFAMTILSFGCWITFQRFSSRAESNSVDEVNDHIRQRNAQNVIETSQLSPSSSSEIKIPASVLPDHTLQRFSSRAGSNSVDELNDHIGQRNAQNVIETSQLSPSSSSEITIPESVLPDHTLVPIPDGGDILYPQAGSATQAACAGDTNASHSPILSSRHPKRNDELTRKSASNDVFHAASTISKHTAQQKFESSPVGPYETPQPAAWVDLEDFATPNMGRDAALQAEAERLLPLLTEKEPPHDSPTSFSTRAEVVADSDRWFRQRYGGWLWAQHHIHAHHLAAASVK